MDGEDTTWNWGQEYYYLPYTTVSWKYMHHSKIIPVSEGTSYLSTKNYVIAKQHFN